MKGYRTVCANLLAAAPVVADIVMPILASSETRDLLPDAWLPWYALALVIMNVGLRFITTSQVFRAEPEDE